MVTRDFEIVCSMLIVVLVLREVYRSFRRERARYLPCHQVWLNSGERRIRSKYPTGQLRRFDTHREHPLVSVYHDILV